MAWLSDWAKRIEITVDNANIDSDLTHFPVPIVLGTSVGQSSDDVSVVFDELTSDANRKKIAVTKSDGITQIYAEIETWDDANESAVLWVSKSDLTITAASTTTLYLYYDSSKADNTTWVGDSGDSPAQDVWDSNFKAVFHMSQDPTGGSNCIKDSTSNANHGTPNGSMTSGDLVDGILGKCLEFDGSDDYISIGSDSSLSNIGADSTIEASIKVPNVSGVKDIFEAYENSFYRSELFVNGTEFCTGNYLGHACTITGPISSSTWHNLVLVINFLETSADNKKYVDNVLEQTVSGGGTLDDLGTWTATIGKEVEDPNPFSGDIDEVRISDVVRYDAWRKANHYAITDNLLTFGTEEVTAYKIYGEVRVNSVLSNRKIRIYNRSTGNLVAKADSVGGNYIVANSESGTQYSGEFISGELISGEYYQVVCISNLSGEYSSDIVDRVKPEQYTIS